jgi:predicted dehydrogenase
MSEHSGDPSRRDVLRWLGTGLAASALPVPVAASSAEWRTDLAPPPKAGATRMLGVPFARHETVRLAIVGTGLRGRSMLEEFLAIDGVRITALCDVVAEKAELARAMVTKAGQPEPKVIVAGERGFEQLVRRDDIDFVYIATPWEWHVPMALAAMRAGKHVGVEVPAATTIADCWALVDTSEQTRRHCLMMENCCYGYSELFVLQLARQGALGEILHGEAAYLHDLREILFEGRDEGLWRRAPHTRRDGNLYPTHGLGPVAQYMGVHRGDRFDYLVSMSSPERGLTAWREQTVTDRTDPRWRERYRCGDINTSLIKTAKGRTIVLQHDVVNPRPYDRLNRVQGTKGAFMDYPPRVYLDGQAGGEKWAPIDSLKAQYEHPLWTRVGEIARRLGGHGGMDFVMAYRLVQCLREGLAPDFDVYDAAAWSAPGPLSERSVQLGSAPVPIPDFTRGAWRAAT